MFDYNSNLSQLKELEERDNYEHPTDQRRIQHMDTGADFCKHGMLSAHKRIDCDFFIFSNFCQHIKLT